MINLPKKGSVGKDGAELDVAVGRYQTRWVLGAKRRSLNFKCTEKPLKTLKPSTLLRHNLHILILSALRWILTSVYSSLTATQTKIVNVHASYLFYCLSRTRTFSYVFFLLYSHSFNFYHCSLIMSVLELHINEMIYHIFFSIFCICLAQQILETNPCLLSLVVTSFSLWSSMNMFSFFVGIYRAVELLGHNTGICLTLQKTDWSQ